METKYIGVKRLLIMTALILLAAIIAIIFHAILPASADVAQFDSIFVKWFGFPAVSTFYFILLFTQCALAVRFIGVRADVPAYQIGVRFGIAFALIYLLGMQEVVIEGSPFSTWGLEFVKYQLIMGIGDGLPAILLCMAVAYFTLSGSEKSKPVNKLGIIQYLKVGAIFVIAILAERTIGYESGLINSTSSIYPIPCYIWTGLFGMLMGYTYVYLYPLLGFKKKPYSMSIRFIATIGSNWMIFNSFIGLILKGAMLQMILRSGLDVAVLALASIIVEKYCFTESFLKTTPNSFTKGSRG